MIKLCLTFWRNSVKYLRSAKADKFLGLVEERGPICPQGGAVMAKISEKYEVMYIINPNVGEEGIAALVAKFKALIEQNGTIEEMEEMGKRKLAYDINYISEGYYVLVKFTSAPSFPAELDRIFGITEGILRSLITLRAE